MASVPCVWQEQGKSNFLEVFTLILPLMTTLHLLSDTLVPLPISSLMYCFLQASPRFLYFLNFVLSLGLKGPFQVMSKTLR